MRWMKRNYAKAGAKARRKRDKKKQRRISRISMAIFAALCVFVAFFLTRSSAKQSSQGEVITLKVADVEIKRGEEKPVFSAEAICEGDLSGVLDESSGYVIASLVEELNRGVGYILECEADGSKEGQYPIKAELTSELTTPLYSEWFGKISIEVQEGTFTVKNPDGEWKADRFQLWEGGYAKARFIEDQGKTYYVDQKGQKVSGWQEIEGGTYYFNKKGCMKTGWMKTKAATYYFDENGLRHSGWLRLGEEKYYFDTDGKMVTGERKIGTASYTFDADGVMTASEGAADPEKPMVALTFDDGPGAYTMELLESLEKNQARATFFMLGQNVNRYPDAVKKMAEIGCELGNHSYDHPNLANLSAKKIKQQIGDTNTNVLELTGQQVTVMRPPFGSINNKVRENVGLPMILWSIDTLDWQTRNAKKTIKNVMSQVQDGDIILLHDIHAESVAAAKKLIPKLQKAGYQLVTVSELADARGITLEAGEKYGRFRPEN